MSPRRAIAGPLLRSLAGLLWFSTWFFLLFPAAVLHVAGGPWVPDPPPPGAPRTIGVAIAGFAFVWVIVEALRFVVRGRGTLLPFEATRVLVAEGPFRFVRNPMYLLYLVVVLGEAIAFRSVALLVYALSLFALAHLYVVKREEALLRERFGKAYDAYCDRVPRWLPRRTFPLDVRSRDATTRNSRGIL